MVADRVMRVEQTQSKQQIKDIHGMRNRYGYLQLQAAVFSGDA